MCSTAKKMVAEDVDEKMPAANVDEKVPATNGDDETKRWQVGDRVCCAWAGNGYYYPATVEAVDYQKRTLKVQWDDQEDSHRIIPFDQVTVSPDDTTAWSVARIDHRASVRSTPNKGRCLFTNVASDPGHVVFVEKPLLVALPASAPKLWEHLTKTHEAQPLNLGTVTFHFAALVSLLQLDKQSIGIILDKFVPDPDEQPGEDVVRILKSIEENKAALELSEKTFEAREVQRLVSAWRYNSFGHHKEDGLVLYNRISMCAHSCDPSCCWSYGEEDAFVLRSRLALKKDDELTISYLQDDDLLKSIAVRQTKLQNWRFQCACTRCCLTVDVGRGFKCRKCRVGIVNPTTAGTLEPCNVCTGVPSQDEQQMLLQLEGEYATRVENLEKTDVADVETVYLASIEIFERHWILYVMDTMLWEAYKEKRQADAVEHQRRRIEFHEHYYCRPTFVLAWCHEELGDSLQNLFPARKWHCVQEFMRAYQMLVILCGANHQYTASPYHKLIAVQNSGTDNKATTNNTSTVTEG
jgi:hypothetical protein